ncbi:MAG: CBS domain-containing protein [Acidimicrobiales bacterium]|jgi:CBS domain-containing protein
MRIANLLASKGTAVATIRPDAAVIEAVAALVEHRIGALVVSLDGEHIEGILSERDIVMGLHDKEAALLTEPVSSIMSSTVYTCAPGDDTDSLMSTMTERRVRHVPVVEDDVLVGIVSIGDIVKTRMGELEKDRKELVDYINAR